MMFVIFAKKKVYNWKKMGKILPTNTSGGNL